MSRNACFAFLFMAASICCSVSRPAVAAPGEGKPKRAEVREKLLQKFDKNGNGQLDPDEREAAKEAMQKRREQGGGKGQAGQAARAPERHRKLLEKFDTDGDGKLSETERAAAKEARAKRVR